jgi:hypothetical protein
METHLEIKRIQLRRQEHSQEHHHRDVMQERRGALPIERGPVVRRELAEHAARLGSQAACLSKSAPRVWLSHGTDAQGRRGESCDCEKEDLTLTSRYWQVFIPE